MSEAQNAWRGRIAVGLLLLMVFAAGMITEAWTARLRMRHMRGAEVARLDHFNICVPDVPRAYEYYSGLGFGLSETIDMHDGEARDTRLRWDRLSPADREALISFLKTL